MSLNSIRIIEYEEAYRDDMIFMVLQAKDAIGRRPRINADLLDIKSYYFDKGDMFWLALDENDRVVGCGGYSRVPDTNEAFVHRLYVKPSIKRTGIGSALLERIERGMKEKGVTVSRVHLGEPEEQWFESYAFYPKHGYKEYATRYMLKEL